MAWTADEARISDSEREELMSIGAEIVADIDGLVRNTSRAIRTRFAHGVTLIHGGIGSEPVRSVQIVLLFTITELGGSEEDHVKFIIGDRLREIFEDPSMLKYKAPWAFEVVSGEK